MDVVTILLVVLLLGGAGIAWYLVKRYLQQSATADMRLDNRADGVNELAAFVAAYRSGQIEPQDLQPDTPANKAVPTTAAPLMPQKPVAARTSDTITPAPAKATSTGSFLRPEVKLAYLSLRAGLRDHHVFPNVPLADLGFDQAGGRIDLIVYNPEFAIVAAIDVFAGSSVADSEKGNYLRSAGIRYLRFNVKAMPKLSELRTLLYRT